MRVLARGAGCGLAQIMDEEGVTYMYIKHNNLFLLAVTDVNASAAMILLFLYQVVEVCLRRQCCRSVCLRLIVVMMRRGCVCLFWADVAAFFSFFL